ncbi:MAG: hypothetical protein ABI056_07205, partial [Caulobacteraceae bacterium]
RAILMFVAPQVYIAGILGGAASRAQLPNVARSRATRLQRRVEALRVRPPDLSMGELAAMSWACELLGLAEVAESFDNRVIWIDFENFLEHSAAGLRAVLEHLHGSAEPGEIAALLRSPDFQRYSKAPAHAFDVASRRRVLARSAVENRMEIQRGLAWLNAAGGAHGAIAAAARLAAAAPRLI